MNWGIIFGKEILDKGRQIYNAGKVKDLKYVKGHYEAMVRDNLPCHVEITIFGNVIRSMTCTCPAADKRRYCEHMAAALTAIERRRVQARLKEEAAETAPVTEANMVIAPFEEAGDSEYSYFDMARMTSGLTFIKGLCERAKKMADSREVTLDDVTVGYVDDSRNQENVGRADGTVHKNGSAFPVKIYFDKNQIRDARCSVPGCGRYYAAIRSYGMRQNEDGLCVHQTALLYLLADYVKQYRPGDTTDLGGARVMWQYREKRGLERGESMEGSQSRTPCVYLTLEPRLESDGNQFRVAFRIGEGRMYLVKNLTELVEAVQERRSLQLGTRLKIDFADSCFTEESRKYYEFIEQVVKEEKHREETMFRRYRYGHQEFYIKGTIELFGRRLDEMFELLYGKCVEYVDSSESKSRKQTLTLEDGEPYARLTVEKDVDEGGVFQGIKVEGVLSRMWEGDRYYYCIRGACLNRVTAARARELMPLYEAESGKEQMLYYKKEKDSHVSFRIGRKHLSEFYYTMLPDLRRLGDVEERDKEEVDGYLPPEVTFGFYLDAEDRNAFCQIRAIYGNEAVSVIDLTRGPNVPVKEEFRDVTREREVIARVQEFFPEADRKHDQFHCGGDENLIYEMLERGIDQLLSMGEVHSTDRFRHLNVRRRARLSVGVSLSSDIMNLEIYSEDITREELLDVLQSYRQKKKFYRLKNGDFLNMEEDSLEMLCQLMDGLRMTPREFVKGKMQLPAYRALYLDQMLEQSESLYATRDRRFKKLVKEFKTVKDSDFEVPEPLQKIMRNYQVTGYKWIRTLAAYGFGGILADDMGLGKTLQMISVLLAYKLEGGEGTSLIVSPASLVFNWQEELTRFAPQLTVGLIVGAQGERMERLHGYRSYDVLITSYDLLKRDILEYEDCRFFCQVIDEAQYIKNHSTAASKAVKVIHAGMRFALTGTPIENRLSELWSIFDYLMPGFLYNYEAFKKELESPIAKFMDEAATVRLKKLVAPFILRRLKQDVLKDLPEKLEETHFARLENKQRKLYDAQVLHMREMLEDQSDENFQKNKLRVLAELMKVRQICCDPSLFLEDYDGGSAKREMCMELIANAIEGEHKMLVFSQFTSMLMLLEKDLERAGISYYKITGATAKEKRIEMVKAFNEDQTPVFLISLKAGGTGLNLTGADVVIHYDPWWNLAVQNQATDRAHRIGQRKVVSVYKLIVKDSIEEKIQRMQEDKKNLADAILSGENGGIGRLSREELLELIR